MLPKSGTSASGSHEMEGLAWLAAATAPSLRSIRVSCKGLSYMPGWAACSRAQVAAGMYRRGRSKFCSSDSTAAAAAGAVWAGMNR